MMLVAPDIPLAVARGSNVSVSGSAGPAMLLTMHRQRGTLPRATRVRNPARRIVGQGRAPAVRAHSRPAPPGKGRWRTAPRAASSMPRSKARWRRGHNFARPEHRGPLRASRMPKAATSAWLPLKEFQTSCAERSIAGSEAAWLSVVTYRSWISPVRGPGCNVSGVVTHIRPWCVTETAVRSFPCVNVIHMSSAGFFHCGSARSPTAGVIAVRDAYAHATTCRCTHNRALSRRHSRHVDRAPLVLHAEVAS